MGSWRKLCFFCHQNVNHEMPYKSQHCLSYVEKWKKVFKWIEMKARLIIKGYVLHATDVSEHTLQLSFLYKITFIHKLHTSPWWRHQMETFSALLALCAGNSPVAGEFPTQRAATRSFDVFFDPFPNKRLSKQSRGWWFEMPPRSLWRHNNNKELSIANWIGNVSSVRYLYTEIIGKQQSTFLLIDTGFNWT